MKVGESIKEEDGKLIVKRSYDNTDTLKHMADVRASGVIAMDGEKSIASESRYVGRIPMHLVEQWCREAGVKWDDIHARGEVVKRKILSGDFDKLRTDWKGTW